MAGGHKLTGDLKAEPPVRSGDERRHHVQNDKEPREAEFSSQSRLGVVGGACDYATRGSAAGVDVIDPWVARVLAVDEAHRASRSHGPPPRRRPRRARL